MFTANTEELEEKIQCYKDVGNRSLDIICLTADIKKENKRNNPEIIAFQVDKQILKLLPKIINCSKGTLFLALWDKCGKEAVRMLKRQLEVTEIIEKVWIPAKREFKSFVKNLKSGDITFRKFDIICGRFAKDILRKELQHLEDGNDKKWIGQRIEQMEKYTHLQNYGKGAETIVDVFREFKLKGNIKPIQDILEMVSYNSSFFSQHNPLGSD